MTPALRDRFAHLYDIQRACGIPLVQLALRYVLAREEVSTILIGAKTLAEIEEAVDAVRTGPLPGDLQAEIEALGMRVQSGGRK
jgi:L-glyceraldehyde 3-phosphate reductase